MKKVLLYAMTGEKSCFMHVLLNAVQLHEGGAQVRVVFEGASVKLVRPAHRHLPCLLQDHGCV